MRYTFLIVIIGLFFVACSKDKFTTVPQLKYKSVDPKVLDIGQSINFSFSFTDAEGDVDSIYVEKVNPQCELSNFTQVYLVPPFSAGNNQEGELNVTFSYGANTPYPQIQGPICAFNDTCYFRFVLKDKARNHSDTVSSEQIVIIKH